MMQRLFGQALRRPRTMPTSTLLHRENPTRFLSSWEPDNDESGPTTTLVVGSSGCLGSVICKQLSRQGVSVIGADMIQRDNKDDPSLTGFVSLPRKTPLSLTDLTTSLYSGVSEVLKTTNDSVPSSQSLSAIIVAAGGWQGDAPLAPHEDAIEGAAEYAAVIDAMQSQNLNPVLAAGYLIPYFMTSENGLFVAIGATPALGSTPGMLGYGLAKVGVHHYIATLGDSTGLSAASQGKRQQSKAQRRQNQKLDTLSVIGVLPSTIDTPANRKNMPDADTSQWTPPKDIAKQISSWVEAPVLRPHSGSLIKTVTLPDKGTSFQLVR